jgi:CheY-like chemotaxis protein
VTDRLLVVDDNPDFATLVATVAKTTGYTVLEVTDSTMLEGALGSWSPTHVLIDLNMPTIDGIAALQILARHHSPAKVVICSGAAGDFLDAAKRLGGRLGLEMSGVIQKPIRLKELKDFLESIANASQSTVIVGRAFDRNVFDDLCSTMGREWVIKGLKNFTAQIEATLGEDNPAPSAREQLASGAHELASYAGILGFFEVSHFCRELENACTRNGDILTPLHQAQTASRPASAKALEMIAGLTEQQPAN